MEELSIGEMAGSLFFSPPHMEGEVWSFLSAFWRGALWIERKRVELLRMTEILR